MRFFRTLTLVAMILIGSVLAQDSESKKDAPSKPDPNTVEVRFADDSVVKMVLLDTGIEVKTRYGKLVVPVEEIRSIELGLRIPPETVKRLEAAVSRLGSPDYKQREAAGQELLALNELAYPSLQKAAQSTDAEVARRAKEALKTLISTVPQEKLHLPRHDTIAALDFTMVGHIETTSLKARTPYFGETTLKLAEVRNMRWVGSDREARLTVDAGRYGGQKEVWMDTGLRLRTGMVIQILAGGQVDLRPLPGEAGSMVVGPDGRPRSSRAAAELGLPGGAAGGFGGAAGRGARGGVPATRPSPLGGSGALVGRIGENGPTFVVGSQYQGAAMDEGKLYLRILASTYSTESSGSYDVRVTTGR